MIIKICSYCKKEFAFRNAPSDQGIVCSRACNFKKMNKKVEKECIACNKKFLVHRYRATIAKTCSFKCRNAIRIGELSNGWKGDSAKYAAVHNWLNSNKKKPKNCEWCGEKKKLQWANLSHEYTREMSDWVVLCYSCHFKYDYKKGWGDATRRINAGL